MLATGDVGRSERVEAEGNDSGPTMPTRKSSMFSCCSDRAMGSERLYCTEVLGALLSLVGICDASSQPQSAYLIKLQVMLQYDSCSTERSEVVTVGYCIWGCRTLSCPAVGGW